jgi:ectoine hydroxylase-related dioxygenase (phytanoyl-CoA dioxygenase family)
MEAVERGEYDTGTPPQPSYWNPGDPADKLVKIEMPQIASRAIMALVSHPALGQLAAEVTGAEWIQVWWVQHLAKPPALGSAKTRIGWHQDRNYWGIWEEGSELFTAWVAISDVAEDSGPMRFVPGSHLWGLLEGSDFYGQDHDAQRQTMRVPAGSTWEEVPAILSPGGVSFHHCLTLHASGQNQSATMRRSFAIHMRTEKSNPVNGERKGLASFIDDPTRCPVIYRTG